MEQLTFVFKNEQAALKPVLRDAKGRLLAGHPNGHRFKKGEINNPTGRNWHPSKEVRKQAKADSKYVVNELIATIENSRYHVTYRLQAIALYLQLAYGRKLHGKDKLISSMQRVIEATATELWPPRARP